MDKLKVFISSTMTELNDERAVVKRALDERDMEAVWFEGFGAQPNTPQQAYLAAVEDSDVYLGLFWNRYSAATEEEYRKALALKKPMFVYVKNFDVRREVGLETLLGELGKQLVYKAFSNVIELMGFVQHDIVHWLVEQYRKTRAQLVRLQHKALSASETRLETLADELLNHTQSYRKKEARLESKKKAVRFRADKKGADFLPPILIESHPAVRLARLSRSLPPELLPAADRQAFELVRAARAAGLKDVRQYALKGGDALVIVDMGSKAREQHVAVQFTGGKVTPEAKRLLADLQRNSGVTQSFIVAPPTEAQPPRVGAKSALSVLTFADLKGRFTKLNFK